MAEFAAVALEAVASAGAEVAATAETAATAAGVSAGETAASSSLSFLSSINASTVGSILQGGATALSVLGAVNSGNQQADALRLQANDADTNQKVETVQGLERRASIRAALLTSLGERDVATAAGGTDVSFGTPVQARTQAVQDSARALNLDETTTDFNRQRLAERAASLRAMANNAQSGGLIKGLSLAGLGATSQMRRG